MVMFLKSHVPKNLEETLEEREPSRWAPRITSSIFYVTYLVPFIYSPCSEFCDKATPGSSSPAVEPNCNFSS